MSFADDMERHLQRLRADHMRTFVRSTEEVKRSVVEGSELTGAPGQPVDTANLRNSFTDDFTSETEWALHTNVAYAPEIEDNERGATLRSEVGGFHSVAKTRAGWDRIVDHVAAEVRGG